MSSIVKMQVRNSDLEALPASSPQPVTVLAEESATPSDHTLLDLLATLSTRNGIVVVQHGARLAVVGELLVAMLTHLPVEMRAGIVESFRDRIEDLMSLSDDRSLPEQYHSALLTEVNRYLNALQ